MKAMILAAGRGERMRPLTDVCPKPLIKVAGKPLIVYHIENLVRAGFSDIVINHAWLGEQIEQAIGDGSEWGANVVFSAETNGGLETAGGIIAALPKLGDEPFLVVNGDIWTDFDFANVPRDLQGQLAHLVLVDNPEHNPNGDFGLATQTPRLVLNEADCCFTFSGIAVYHPDLFAGVKAGKSALPPLMRRYMGEQCVSGEKYDGLWTDVGTVERLSVLEKRLINDPTASLFGASNSLGEEMGPSKNKTIT
jgi:MurNAc alpha-1-phosphate uridylyltransferase